MKEVNCENICNEKKLIVCLLLLIPIQLPRTITNYNIGKKLRKDQLHKLVITVIRQNVFQAFKTLPPRNL